MSKVHKASTLVSDFTARLAQPGTVDIAASAASTPTFPKSDDSVPTIQAGGVHSFSAPGKLQYVKASEHFLVLGETVQAGEYVELPEIDAKYLVRIGRAELASDADVAAAQKASK